MFKVEPINLKGLLMLITTICIIMGFINVIVVLFTINSRNTRARYFIINLIELLIKLI